MAHRLLRGSAALGLLLAACGAETPEARYDGEGRLLGPFPELRADNVLLVSIDTLRADHLGCYGYDRPTSPRLDALAAEGVVFERAIASSPWTTPSHISLMTSLDPGVHGVLGYPVPGELDRAVVTLAEVLRAQGWRTAAFTEGGYAKAATGLGHGFETFPAWPGDAESFVSHELEPSRLEENAARAAAWLEEHRHERFFLFFHTYEPHFEYRPPPEDLAVLAPDLDLDAERQALEAAVAAWNAGRVLGARSMGVLARHFLQGDVGPVRRPRRLGRELRRFIDETWAGSPGFAEDLAYVTALYDAEIRFADRVVGELLERLDAWGLRQRTLVVVTSDHGEGLMDHGMLHHGKNLFDELLRVPLIVRFPDGRGAGRRIAAQVSGLDLFPTLLDWIGLPAPAAAQGASLLPLLRGEAGGRVSFAEGLTRAGRERSLVMLRTDGWKLVRDLEGGGERLFDLGADPGELLDRAAEDRSVLHSLRRQLDARLAENAARATGLRVSPGALTEGERRRLEALGYLGEEGP